MATRGSPRSCAAPAGAGARVPAPARGSEPAGLTVAGLLASLDQPDSRLGPAERAALTTLADDRGLSPAHPPALTDRQLQGALLGRLLEAVTGKPPAQAVVADVLQPLRSLPRTPAPWRRDGPKELASLAVSAGDLGRFFLKYRLDGRPLPSRAKPAAGAIVGRQGDALALVLHQDDLLLVVLLRLPDDAPPQLVDDLRAGLDHAMASLSSPHPPTANRRSSTR